MAKQYGAVILSGKLEGIVFHEKRYGGAEPMSPSTCSSIFENREAAMWDAENGNGAS